VNVGVSLLRVPRCVRVLMWVNLWRGMLLWNNFVISSVDSPWQVAVAKMDALPVQPTIDCERLTPGVCMLDN
jgi:hypothetical protein